MMKCSSEATVAGLESVHFELIRFDQLDFDEPVADFCPLIALQLEDFSVLGVLYDGSVAGELFLARAHNLLEVILGAQALNRGQRLATVALLDADVHQTVLDTADVFVSSFGRIRERIC